MREDWTQIRLGDISKISSGKAIPSTEIEDEYSNGLYPCYGGNGLRGYTKEYLYDGTYPIIGRVGALCGNVHLANGKFYPTEHALVMSLNGKELPHFIEYLLLSLNLNQYAKGVAQPVLSASTLSDLKVSLPPLSEQERIVAELDLLSGIIDKQKAQLRELDNLAQSIFYDMFGDPVKNEKGWKAISFKNAFRLRSGDGLTEKEFISGDYPVFGGNGISGYHNTFNKDGKYIIIGRVGAYCGNVRFVNGRFWLTDNAFEAFFNTEEFNFWFTCYLLNTINLHKYANHAAQPVISNIGLKDISIISPPSYLQQSFAAKIESLESQKTTINCSIVESQKLFNYTMDKYFG